MYTFFFFELEIEIYTTHTYTLFGVGRGIRTSAKWEEGLSLHH